MTTTVIAAVDADAAMLPALQAAEILAGIYRARLEVVHVETAHARTVDLPAAFARVPVRVIDGDVAAILTAEMERDDVIAAAMGARSVAEAVTPAGHIALAVASGVDKPVALVLPEHEVPTASRLRVLVPLDGTEDAATTVSALVQRVADADVEVVVLHVFDPPSGPAFFDRSEHDLPAWGHEFLARHCDAPGSRMVWRTGRAGQSIAEAAASEHVDAVILGWSGTLEPGRAAVVREVLSRARVPVVLVPRSFAERTLRDLRPSQ